MTTSALGLATHPRTLFVFVMACQASSTRSSNSNRSSSGNVEGLFEQLAEFGSLDEGHFLESFNELFGGKFSHGGNPFKFMG